MTTQHWIELILEPGEGQVTGIFKCDKDKKGCDECSNVEEVWNDYGFDILSNEEELYLGKLKVEINGSNSEEIELKVTSIEGFKKNGDSDGA